MSSTEIANIGQAQAQVYDKPEIGNTNQDFPQQAKSSTPSDIAGTTCMELALEGERLCQSGDLKNGVKFFEEAIKVGTNDDRTLSAMYSQLGNAYFYLEDYQKALDYHKQDVHLVHAIGDEAAEAKACGNLGNTFKMLGKFDEAAVYCRRYLEISRKLKDQIGEGRALYNLGNVYHMQGKRMIGNSEQESGELPQDIKSSLLRAIEYYEANLKVVIGLKDYVAMGRAYGNLGNTHYLLGNFNEAVESHKKRLELAKKTGDKSAERRAHLNLGNANVFLGNFPEAIDNYSETLKLAQELQDKHTEAHSCYSLANTYTFLRDYDSAIEYHLKYLELIRELDDKLGEGRACWSLVNVYQMVNDPDSALIYAKRHHEIAGMLGDETGLACARSNIEELEETIAQKQAVQQLTISSAGAANSSSSTSATQTTVRELALDTDLDKSKTNVEQSAGAGGGVSDKRDDEGRGHHHHRHRHHQNSHRHQQQQQQHHHAPYHGRHLSPDKRQEQEQRRFKKQLNGNLADIDGLAAARRRGRSSSTAMGDGKMPSSRGPGMHKSTSSEQLFDMIANLQKGRIDDQRCEILRRPIPNSVKSTPEIDKENNELGSSACASNSQRGGGSGPSASPAAAAAMMNPKSAVSAAASAIRATYRKASLAAYPVASQALQSIQSQRRPTMSAEHRLFDMIADAQGKRMDEQRASLPTIQMANGVLKNPSLAGPTLGHAPRANQVETIPENLPSQRFKQRSQSIAQAQSSDLQAAPPSSTSTSSTTNEQSGNNIKSKIGKLTKHFQTFDSDHHASDRHDEKFQLIDSLMKYQSTRFNDQRSEFPKQRGDYAGLNQARPEVLEPSGSTQDDFLNLLVKFGTDRIDDQRSAPPPSSKNAPRPG